MAARENSELKANVISMYKSRFQREGFLRPKIVYSNGKIDIDSFFDTLHKNFVDKLVSINEKDS